jgi:hypothetical protein
MKLYFYHICILSLFLMMATTACGGTASTPPPDLSHLGEEVRSEAGGFAFRPIPGYKVDDTFGYVTMNPPEAETSNEPIFLLVGGDTEPDTTLDTLYEEFITGFGEGAEYTNKRDISVGGEKGLATDVSVNSAGVEIKGRVVVVLVNSSQHFTMVGSAPKEDWDNEFSKLFDDITTSISFFDPIFPEEDFDE